MSITTPLTEALFNGLSNSSILILAALGLTITFGVMRIINMAHGEMMMLGAYTGYVLTNADGLPKIVAGFGKLIHRDWHTTTQLHLNVYIAIPIVFLVVGLAGYLLERGLIRFLYGRPLDTLLATWGVGLVLQQGIRLTFGADPQPLLWPAELVKNWSLGEAAIPFRNLFIIGVTVAALAMVYLVFFWTPLGLKVRAVTQNRPMASALGISTSRVDAFAFAFGSGLAGVAGYVLGHQVGQALPNMGTDYIIDAFIVVILGGLGRLAGTVPAAIVVGLGNSILEKVFANAFTPQFFPDWIQEVSPQMARVVVLLMVIGFIMVRPAGLLALKERVYD